MGASASVVSAWTNTPHLVADCTPNYNEGMRDDIATIQRLRLFVREVKHLTEVTYGEAFDFHNDFEQVRLATLSCFSLHAVGPSIP